MKRIRTGVEDECPRELLRDGTRMNTAIVTAVFALVGVFVTIAANQHLSRRDRLLKDFAEALAAVERYAELPYRVLRRQGSGPEARERVAEAIHGVQQELLFHKSWVRIQDPRVADAYDALLAATREEAGGAMTEAWRSTPIAADEDMPLGVGLSFPLIEERRAEYVNMVRCRLQWPPLRWAREYAVPWAVSLRERKASDTH
jgi:hypothetical protein